MVSASEQSVTLSVPEGVRSITDILDQERFHLVLGIAPEVNAIIEELALRYGGNKADAIGVAIGLLKYLSDAVQSGKRVGIATDDQELETEITGL